MREALVTIGNADFEDLGIEELVSLYRNAGIRDFEELACHGESSIIQVEVEERVDEDRLEALAYVDEWERLDTTRDHQVYVISFYAPDLSDEIADEVADLMGTCEPVIGEDGVTMSLVGPQEAIAGTLEEYESEGVSPDLRKLGEYQGRAEPLDELTDRQREVLETAFEMGYYEVPREVSNEEVSAELDLDSSTVAEHLQRAERNLLSYHLTAE
ncbi:MAG: helix-turn-helix domain-containing protein [Halobacteriales archaeon]